MATTPQAISGMTDFPSTEFDGTEKFPLIWPGTPGLAVNYSIDSFTLAALIYPLIGGVPTILEDEASYNSVGTDTRILVKNSMALSTSIVLLTAGSYNQAVLIKDIGGYASEANPITVTFSSGEKIDGLSTITITNPYGWMWFNPLEAGNFYAT